ncbi:MAG: Mrp/NBP35 family ATP-binding protein [Clostridia bacterium]|nr:Mrp/NBP35 family ATP-binding protein [Clostridia bacterium]
MADCTYDCSSCGVDCSSRRAEDFLKKPHRLSKIKHVVAVVSGKGGVGKSMTCASLAVEAARRGLNVGVMDADLTGPSVPRMFGLHDRAMGSEDAILPCVTKEMGIQVMSMNLLLENEDDPVVWRGSLISGTVTQFWTDVIWQGLDILFIDMPPGTGDVPLTVFQSIPLDGAVVVTTPQDLVGMIVAKCVNMADMMNVPILGIVENMSYVKCPCCEAVINVFGQSSVDALALEHGIPCIAKMPVDPALATSADTGKLEEADTSYLREFFDGLMKELEKGSKGKDTEKKEEN